MLLKPYSLKSNLSKLTSGPYFISSIKFLKCLETNSCTSLTIPGKWLFPSHLNHTLKHQKKISNLLGRDPSLKVKWRMMLSCKEIFFVFSRNSRWRWWRSSAGHSHKSWHPGTGEGFLHCLLWATKTKWPFLHTHKHF